MSRSRRKTRFSTQIDNKQKEINQLQDPIIRAQLYTVEQIAMKYEAAQQAVITAAKKINVILAPDAFVWAPDAVDVTTQLLRRNSTSPIPVRSTQRRASRLASIASGRCNCIRQIQQLFDNSRTGCRPHRPPLPSRSNRAPAHLRRCPAPPAAATRQPLISMSEGRFRVTMTSAG